MGILRNVRKVGFASMLTTVVSGFYMMVTDWGGVAWIYVPLEGARPGDRALGGAHGAAAASRAQAGMI